MLFNSWNFIAFLAVVLAVTASMRRYGTPWRLTLLAASYFFYSQWDWRYCGLILASTLVDYWLALRLDARRYAYRYIVASITVNLAFLGFFKYANFIVGSLNAAASLANLQPLAALDIVLPVGISFFTFQAMSYTIDVYRGEMRARRSLLDYALYVAFFPQLLAGPIVRAREFFEQLDNPSALDLREMRYALVLISLGLVKKIVFADSLAAAIDPAWKSIAEETPFEALTAVYGFALQIYFDFSGYTDVAIGVALLLGLRFPANFNYPYMALSIQDFWRRWHMTLSRWLRDYLYFSLGGNRLGVHRTYVNLFITMLLGGLWHGASWNFVLWGGLHGMFLAFERMPRIAMLLERASSPWSRCIRWFVTFHLVCFTWIFFRSPDLPTSFAMIAKIASLPQAMPGWTEAKDVLLIAAVFFAWQWIASRTRLKERLGDFQIPWTAAVSAACLALAWFTPARTIPFIYFQF